MRALQIDAENGKILEVFYDGKKRPDLKDMQEAVGGYIEIAHRFNNKDVLLVDEEGILKRYAFGFFILGGHQPFYGNGLVCRMGKTDAAMTRQELQAMVRFWKKDEEVT